MTSKTTPNDANGIADGGETLWTTGPWIIEEGHIQRDSGGIRYWQITDGQDAIACNQFCYANFNSETAEANARLIASAPELLEALGEAFSTLIYIFECSDDEHVSRAAKEASDKIEAAISKATAPVRKAGA